MKTVKQIDRFELTTFDKYETRAGFQLHALTMPNEEARFAMALVERWGLVVGEPDGEDSAGRSKLRTLNPGELANKACSAAEALFLEMNQRGWILDIPSMADLDDMRKTDDDSN